MKTQNPETYKLPEGWKIIPPDQKPQFIAILDMLVMFEEKTRKRENLSEDHGFRKLILSLPVENTEIYVARIDGIEPDDILYAVIAESKTSSSYSRTSWLHEDGLEHEKRLEFRDIEDHPVHKIITLTNIYEASGSVDSNVSAEIFGMAADHTPRDTE